MHMKQFRCLCKYALSISFVKLEFGRHYLRKMQNPIASPSAFKRLAIGTVYQLCLNGSLFTVSNENELFVYNLF